MRRARGGFSLVSIVSFMGTIAVTVAIVQSDTVMTALRRGAYASTRTRLRTAAATAAIAAESGTGTLDLDRVHLTFEPGAVTAAMPAPALRRARDARPMSVRFKR